MKLKPSARYLTGEWVHDPDRGMSKQKFNRRGIAPTGGAQKAGPKRSGAGRWTTSTRETGGSSDSHLTTQESGAAATD